MVASPQLGKILASVRNDPAIDSRHQAVSLGCGYERHRRNQRTIGIDHANENFKMRALIAAAPRIRVRQRADLLSEKSKPIELERRIDLFNPLHFTVSRTHLLVVGPIDLHAIASIVLRQVAGLVRGTQGVIDRRQALSQGKHADTGVDRKYLALPKEALLRDASPDRLGEAHGRMRLAVRKQNTKLITTQTREQVAAAQPLPYRRRYLADQLVAGGMSAGVIDDFELIQIQIQ